MKYQILFNTYSVEYLCNICLKSVAHAVNLSNFVTGDIIYTCLPWEASRNMFYIVLVT